MFKAPVPYKREKLLERASSEAPPSRDGRTRRVRPKSFSTVITFEKHQLDFENINITNNATLKNNVRETQVWCRHDQEIGYTSLRSACRVPIHLSIACHSVKGFPTPSTPECSGTMIVGLMAPLP